MVLSSSPSRNVPGMAYPMPSMASSGRQPPSPPQSAAALLPGQKLRLHPAHKYLPDGSEAFPAVLLSAATGTASFALYGWVSDTSNTYRRTSLGPVSSIRAIPFAPRFTHRRIFSFHTSSSAQAVASDAGRGSGAYQRKDSGKVWKLCPDTPSSPVGTADFFCRLRARKRMSLIFAM